jgi:hypothetical protein
VCVPFLKEKACELLEKYPTSAREASDSGVGKGIILVSRGLHALGVESLRSGETREGVFYLSRAIEILDVAMDFTPGVGWAKDCIQAISGVNPITGEKLSTFERSAALIGAVTVGFGSKFLKGFKAITKHLKGNSVVSRLVGRFFSTLKHSRIDISDITRGTSNVNDYLKLKAELKFLEAGFIDFSRNLTHKAITHSKVVTKGKSLKNPKVIRELTKDGSSMAQWAKYKTSTVRLGNGQPLNIHFYYNEVSRKVNQTIDFKVKQGLW